MWNFLNLHKCELDALLTNGYHIQEVIKSVTVILWFKILRMLWTDFSTLFSAEIAHFHKFVYYQSQITQQLLQATDILKDL